jgi:hypothetical protein
MLDQELKRRERWLRVSKPDIQPLSKHPEIIGTRRFRHNKQYIYEQAKLILDKHNITGEYIGLAADRMEEIYSTFNPHITRFTNCEIRNDFYSVLKQETGILNQEYENSPFCFYSGDIYERMLFNPDTYSVIDLDLMKCLRAEDIEQIFHSITWASKDKCLVMLWSSYGHAITERYYDFDVKPEIRKQCCKYFHRLDYRSFKYRDNVIPMKVEMLTLKNRVRSITKGILNTRKGERNED